MAFTPIRSQDDKKTIGYLRKKSKKKKINVYFNKRNSTTRKN